MSRAERSPAVVIGDLTLVRPLAMAGIPTVVVTTDPKDLTLSSRHVRRHLLVPGFEAEASPATLEALVELGAEISAGRRRRVPLVYGSDETQGFVQRHREALGRSYLLLLNDDELAESMLDKERFAALAAERGVSAPRTLASGGDVLGRLSELRAPLLVKPKRKVRWYSLQAEIFAPEGKARVFETADELLAHPGVRTHIDDLVVQEYVPGGESALYSFHGYSDREGRILASFSGRKVRAYPLTTGESACIELVVDEALAAYGAEVAGRFGLRGPFKLDIIRDERDGTFYTLEVNARFNLWHYLGAVHGVNLLEVAYRHLVGEPVAWPTTTEYVPRYRWVNVYRDWKAFQQKSSRGELRLPEWLWSVARGPNVYECFAWDDPLPAVRWLGRQLGAKVSRWNGSAS